MCLKVVCFWVEFCLYFLSWSLFSIVSKILLSLIKSKFNKTQFRNLQVLLFFFPENSAKYEVPLAFIVYIFSNFVLVFLSKKGYSVECLAMCTGKLCSPLKSWRNGQHVHLRRGIFVDVILIMNQNLENSF